MAMKYSSDWEPYQVLRMINCCLALIMTIPQDFNEDITADLDIRLMSCDFLASLLLVALARAEDEIEIQLDNYLSLRRHTKDFDERLEQRIGYLEEVVTQDLLDKLGVLLAWDLEAAIQLKQWDDLQEIIRKAETCKNVHTFEVMADCVLSSEASNLGLFYVS